MIIVVLLLYIDETKIKIINYSNYSMHLIKYRTVKHPIGII